MTKQTNKMSIVWCYNQIRCL